MFPRSLAERLDDVIAAALFREAQPSRADGDRVRVDLREERRLATSSEVRREALSRHQHAAREVVAPRLR